MVLSIRTGTASLGSQVDPPLTHYLLPEHFKMGVPGLDATRKACALPLSCCPSARELGLFLPDFYLSLGSVGRTRRPLLLPQYGQCQTVLIRVYRKQTYGKCQGQA